MKYLWQLCVVTLEWHTRNSLQTHRHYLKVFQLLNYCFIYCLSGVIQRSANALVSVSQVAPRSARLVLGQARGCRRWF